MLSKRPQDVNAEGGNYGTPLHAAISKRDVEIVWLLLENGADLNIRDSWGQTPLYLASVEGFPDVVRSLLDRGVDVEALDSIGWTALHVAVVFGRLEVVKILLEHNAEHNSWTSGSCAIIIEARCGRERARQRRRDPVGHGEGKRIHRDRPTTIRARERMRAWGWYLPG
ncbi:ankyrin repeat-containing domain protein [Lactarius indigo]|nr:ankyrin repeat-containing domain protein [Lactarius indigo]